MNSTATQIKGFPIGSLLANKIVRCRLYMITDIQPNTHPQTGKHLGSYNITYTVWSSQLPGCWTVHSGNCTSATMNARFERLGGPTAGDSLSHTRSR